MGKLIFIAIIVLLVYWLIKARKHTDKKIESLADTSEDMVRCAYCGVHLPVSESIANEDNSFCSNEHLHKYLASKS